MPKQKGGARKGGARKGKIILPQQPIKGGGRIEGSPDWIDITAGNYQRHQKYISPVGVIQFNYKRAWHNMCTGFLCGTDPKAKTTIRVISAGHCYTDVCNDYLGRYACEPKRFRVLFDYREGGSPTHYKVRAVLSYRLARLDVAIFTLSSTAASLRHGFYLPQNVMKKDQNVLIVHHPEGSQMKLSKGSITALKNGGLFAHNANTLGGSSGAPVLSMNSGKVIGVHTGAIDYDDKTQYAAENEGVSIQTILSK